MQSTAPSLWLVRDHGWASRPELLLSTPLPHAANLSHELWLKCAGLELPLQAVRQLQDELEDAPSRSRCRSRSSRKASRKTSPALYDERTSGPAATYLKPMASPSSRHASYSAGGSMRATLPKAA